MKLRISRNSVRIRLDQKDIVELADRGSVEAGLRFGPGVDQQFRYSIKIATVPLENPQIIYASGEFEIRIHPDAVAAWQTTDRVSFSAEQAVEGGTIRILLEKDFAYLD